MFMRLQFRNALLFHHLGWTLPQFHVTCVCSIWFPKFYCKYCAFAFASSIMLVSKPHNYWLMMAFKFSGSGSGPIADQVIGRSHYQPRCWPHLPKIRDSPIGKPARHWVIPQHIGPHAEKQPRRLRTFSNAYSTNNQKFILTELRRFLEKEMIF